MNSSAEGFLFKQNFLMLFQSTMVECKSCEECKFTMLKYIDEEVGIDGMDWCRYVYDYLSVSKSH